MKINININDSKKIIKKHGLDEEGPATRFLRDTVDRFCDPYVPFSSSSGAHLKTLKTYPNNHSIKYESPHAHYHYIGKKAVGPSKPKGVKRTISNVDMKYQGSPRRGPKWDIRMMNDRGQEVCKDLKNFIRNGGK